MLIIFEKLVFLGIKIVTLDYLVVKRIISKYKGNPKRVLDLGCGNGYLSHFFKPSGYLGYDIDGKLIKEAKTKYPKYIFKVGDITKIKINREFELILIIGVIHHLDDKQFENLLKVIKKHLDKKGKVLIIEAIPPISRYNFIGRLIRKMDRGDFIRDLNLYKLRMGKMFKINKVLKVKGGIVDYAFFVLVNKENK